VLFLKLSTESNEKEEVDTHDARISFRLFFLLFTIHIS